MKRILRTLLNWTAINLVVVLPLFWLVTNGLPDRIEMVLKTSVPLMVNVFSCPESSAGVSERVSEGGCYHVGEGQAQCFKIWLKGPRTAARLGFSFETEPSEIEIVSVKKYSRLILGCELDLQQIATAFSTEGGLGVQTLPNGTVRLQIAGKEGALIPTQAVASAWHLNLFTQKKVGLLFCLLELGSVFVAFLLTFLKKDGCSWKQALLQSAVVSLFGAALFTVILPMQSYLVNQSDFKFGLGSLLVSASGWCVLVWICLMLLLLCAERLWGRFVHVVLTMFLVYAYLETGILAIGQPPLNGEINYFLNRAMGLRDGLILVGVVAGGAIFSHWLKNWVHWISLAFLTLAGLSLFDVRAEAHHSSEGQEITSFYSKGEVIKGAFYSAKRNALVFILDMATSEVVEDVIDQDKSLRDKFCGFVCYCNNLGMHMSTDVGTAGMLTGRHFDDPMKITDYTFSIFSGASLLADYQKAEIPQFVLPGSMHFGVMNRKGEEDKPSGEEQVSLSPYLQRFDGQLKWNLYEIVRFRSFPFILKPFIMKLTTYCWPDRGDIDMESILYPRLKTRPVSKECAMTFHWYHTQGCHPPLDVDRDGHHVSEIGFGYNSYFEKIYHALRLLGDLFDTYRQNGVYDNSLIVVCADHGANYGHGRASIKGDLPEKAIPFLWVKPANSSGAFAKSDLPTSHARLASLLRATKDHDLTREEVDGVLSMEDRFYRETSGVDFVDWHVNAKGEVSKKVVRSVRNVQDLKPVALGKTYSLASHNRGEKPDIFCEKLDVASAYAPRLHSTDGEMTIAVKVPKAQSVHRVTLTLETMIEQTGTHEATTGGGGGSCFQRKERSWCGLVLVRGVGWML